MWTTLWALINPFWKETSRGSFVSSHSSGAFQTAEATRQTTQGSTEEVAGRFSQCEPEVPRVRKARRCWQAGRAVPPARCHKHSLKDVQGNVQSCITPGCYLTPRCAQQPEPLLGDQRLVHICVNRRKTLLCEVPAKALSRHLCW